MINKITKTPLFFQRNGEEVYFEALDYLQEIFEIDTEADIQTQNTQQKVLDSWATILVDCREPDAFIEKGKWLWTNTRPVWKLKK
jgi:hypothetical protein